MIGAGVTIKKGAVIRDSIIMKQSVIGENDVIDKAIIAENVTVGDNVVMGIGEEIPNKLKPNVYSFGLVTVGENTVIPSDVKIGKEYGYRRRNHTRGLSRRRIGKRRNIE